MSFSLKSLAAAALLGASVLASAAPLSSIAGSKNWKLQGVTTEYQDASWNYGDETTWGIGEVTQINETNGDAAWTRGEGGTYLYYMLYGIADLQVTDTGNGFEIFNTGCTGLGSPCDGKIHLDIYAHTSALSGILARAPADRTGFGSFAGVTDAVGSSLYLSLELDIGKVAVDDVGTLVDETLATLFQEVNGDILPTSGTGTFYASVVGGSAMDKWDSNGFNGGNSDFDANYTLKPNFTNTGGVCSPSASADECFFGLVNDPIQSIAIPEPTSLALVGLALVGVGALSRRRQG